MHSCAECDCLQRQLLDLENIHSNTVKDMEGVEPETRKPQYLALRIAEIQTWARCSVIRMKIQRHLADILLTAAGVAGRRKLNH